MTRSGIRRRSSTFLSILSIVLAPSLLTAAPIQKGTFTTATEADWGATFELKESGKLIVTPIFSDDPDTRGKKRKPPKTVSGSWRETDGGIELTYGAFKDRFVLQNPCKDWKDHPCLRYQKSLVQTKGKSPLNLRYPYINWDWKAK